VWLFLKPGISYERRDLQWTLIMGAKKYLDINNLFLISY
jgi:hypothetical protein